MPETNTFPRLITSPIVSVKKFQWRSVRKETTVIVPFGLRQNSKSPTPDIHSFFIGSINSTSVYKNKWCKHRRVFAKIDVAFAEVISMKAVCNVAF